MREPETTAGAVLMVRPTGFGFHADAAQTNEFARAAPEDNDAIRARAMHEFENLVNTLQSAGVRTIVVDDDRSLPDAVFPNNWFSWHAPAPGRARVFLYPMATEQRRRERRIDLIEHAARELGVRIESVTDLTHLEHAGAFLEGTGSLVLARESGVAFAARSPRTNASALDAFAEASGYEIVAFDTVSPSGQPAYHTNIIMAIGRDLAVVCTACVPEDQRAELRARIESLGRDIVDLSWNQVECSTGNMLQLRARSGETAWVMSDRARDALTPEQRARIEQSGTIVHAPIPTIERIGGGSVRCMLAELPTLS